MITATAASYSASNLFSATFVVTMMMLEMTILTLVTVPPLPPDKDPSRRPVIITEIRVRELMTSLVVSTRVVKAASSSLLVRTAVALGGVNEAATNSISPELYDLIFKVPIS